MIRYSIHSSSGGVKYELVTSSGTLPYLNDSQTGISWCLEPGPNTGPYLSAGWVFRYLSSQKPDVQMSSKCRLCLFPVGQPFGDLWEDKLPVLFNWRGRIHT